ncbi:hypothetical protein U1Q18_025368, partial [Sarracenia purpurea var. burkii]
VEYQRIPDLKPVGGNPEGKDMGIPDVAQNDGNFGGIDRGDLEGNGLLNFKVISNQYEGGSKSNGAPNLGLDLGKEGPKLHSLLDSSP